MVFDPMPIGTDPGMGRQFMLQTLQHRWSRRGWITGRDGSPRGDVAVSAPLGMQPVDRPDVAVVLSIHHTAEMEDGWSVLRELAWASVSGRLPHVGVVQVFTGEATARGNQIALQAHRLACDVDGLLYHAVSWTGPDGLVEAARGVELVADRLVKRAA